MRVDMYRNLNKPPVTYSVRHRGKGVGYRSRAVLTNCRMKHASEKQLSPVRFGMRQVCQ